MAKIMMYLVPKVEEYDVHIYVYDNSGKLSLSREIKGVKQVVIRSPEVRIGRQLFHEKIAILVESDNPEIELREGLLYIVHKG
ncbi:MAG: hypothetical protein QXJ18_03120 [Desulfurococcaceae archaeon]